MTSKSNKGRLPNKMSKGAIGVRGRGAEDVRTDDGGDICAAPLCYRFDTKFDRKTIKLTSIDLFDPLATDEDERWTLFPPPFEDPAEQAALSALRRTATNGKWDVDCDDDDCECRLSKQKWGDWSPPNVVEISGGFSIPNLKPPPARLRYRANGTVKVSSRMKVGICYAVQV